MVSKVTPLPRKMSPENLKLFRYLKLMYFLGYLPITWKISKDPNFNENFFNNSKIISILIMAFDFGVASTIVILYYVWHLRYMGKDFDLNLIWTPGYVVDVYDGVVTNVVSQLFCALFPSTLFWIYTYLGEKIRPSNL